MTDPNLKQSIRPESTVPDSAAQDLPSMGPAIPVALIIQDHRADAAREFRLAPAVAVDFYRGRP